MKNTIKKRNLLILLVCPMLISCQTTTQTLSSDIAKLGNTLFQNVNLGSVASSALSNQDIISAFKQALSIGTGEVVSQLGVRDGFNLDPVVRIPLPDNLQKAKDLMGKAGLDFMFTDLELRLNRAAELALPEAKSLFINSINQMTFDDVVGIYKGPQDSATQFFKRTMSPDLASRMDPIVNNAIAQAGVISAYDNVMSQYQKIPFMPDIKADLTSYVVDKGIDGAFYYLAEQEKAIRQDPARQTTALLKKVFGAVQ